MLSVPLDVVYIIFPVLMSKYTAKHNPFLMFYKFHAIGMVFVAIGVLFVGVTPKFKNANGEYSFWYFALYMALMSVWYAIGATEYLAVGSIFTNVADPQIGGTCMTLLATVYNLGHMYPNTLALYLVGFFTVKQCSRTSTILGFVKENKCSTSDLSKVNIQCGSYFATMKFY
jgi:hypothetical protein